MTTPAIEARDLVVAYGGRPVLEVEHFAAEAGGITFVVGPNGSGKTTLLLALGLLVPLARGTVRVLGEPAEGARRRALRRRVVMVDEEPWMLAGSVLRNAAYGLRVRGVGRREARRRAMEALERVDLAQEAERPARHLSAGGRRRLALARALAVDPPVLLLDEPTAGLDAGRLALVEGVLDDLRRRGRCIVVATHRRRSVYRLGGSAGTGSVRCVGLVAGRVTEAPLENHFAGTVVERDGEPVMVLGDGCVVHLATEVRGRAHVVIDPRTIVVSRRPAPSSARNALTGRVTALEAHGGRVRVTVDVGVAMTALVTARSAREMALAVGQPVTLTFKSLSVAVYGDRDA